MASKQLKKAIEKVKSTKEPQKYICRVCGRETANCVRQDTDGSSLYCVCSVCAVMSDHPEAKMARKMKMAVQLKNR